MERLRWAIGPAPLTVLLGRVSSVDGQAPLDACRDHLESAASGLARILDERCAGETLAGLHAKLTLELDGTGRVTRASAVIEPEPRTSPPLVQALEAAASSWHLPATFDGLPATVCARLWLW